MTDAENFIMCVGALARSAPKEWDAFTIEFRKRVAANRAALEQASPDLVLMSQGVSRETTKLLDFFTDSAKKATELQNKLESRAKGI